MTNKPETTLRDGTLSATIWKNSGEAGKIFYSVKIIRRYRDDAGNWHDSDSFTGSELLRIAHLATKTYDLTTELKQRDRDATEIGGA